MQIKEIMTRNLQTVRPEATLQEAAQKMKEHDIGPLLVVEGEQLEGVVTDRDIAVRAVAGGDNPMLKKVRDVMTPSPTACFEDQEVSEAAKIMSDKQVRRLPVLDRQRRLVGIVSLADVAIDTKDEGLSGRTLEAVSEPSEPKH